MLSYNSNYEDSDVFTLGGMTTVGLTDCGLQCKVACGCNTANGWYRAVPDGNYTSRTSVKSYDFVIGDDGKLASSGTTLSSSGKSLSGSTKSLSASGSTITCTKQTCSDGYTATKPSDTYFKYDTETLRHGAKCYKVTGCKLYYANKSIASGTDGATAHNGIECYDVLCSDENSNWDASKTGYDHYDNVSSQSSYGNTCYANRRYHSYKCVNGSTNTSDFTYAVFDNYQKCKECSARNTTPCYIEHTHDYYCSETGGTFRYDSASAASPHGSSETGKTKTCAYCTATTTGTCWKQGSHDYSCNSGSSTNSSDFVVAWDDGFETCTKSGCSVNNGVKCYKEHTHGEYFCLSGDTDSSKFTCAVYDNTQICLYGSCTHRNSTKCYIEHTHGSYKCPEGSSTDKSKFISPISAGYQVCGYCSACTHTNSTQCWKEGVQYYTVTYQKTFDSSCPSTVAGAFDGLGGSGGCTVDGQNCAVKPNSVTLNNVKEGSKFVSNEPACYAGGALRAYYKDCTNCTNTSTDNSLLKLEATINSDTTITLQYQCDDKTSCDIGSYDACTASNSEDYIVQFNHSHNQSGSGSIGASCERGGPFTSISVSAEFGCPQGSRRFSGTVNCGGSPKLDNLGTYTDFCAYGSSPTFMSGSFTAGTLTASDGGYFESGGKCYKLIFSD